MAETDEKEAPGFFRRLAEGFAGRDNATVVDNKELELLEAESVDRRLLRKDLDALAWTSLDYMGGNEQDLIAVKRRQLVQQSRIAWQQDSQLGASVDLMNNFTMGRGVPAPKARDAKVQEVLDAAWNDPDNQQVLTSYAAQMALGTDLSIQSNLFMLIFKGGDGRVKLSMLDHDSVENVVRDPENRRKILYYVARRRSFKWDFDNDVATVDLNQRKDREDRVVYYQHWANEPPATTTCPPEKLGKGLVYHVAVNRGTEMAFGHPKMHRVLRWANAFNSLMESRVDAAKAQAAFIMKRKVKGTPNQVRKMATQMLSNSGELGRGVNEGDGYLAGPKGGSILTENEQVEHESFNLDSGSAGANVDAALIRGMISAGTGFPPHYYGDAGNANLATATSMELPVLKSIESFQEVYEQLFRWFIDQVIETALNSPLLDEMLSDEEWETKQAELEQEGHGDTEPQATGTEGVAGVQEAVSTPMDLGLPDTPEDERKRDLSYDFGLPNPLHRMMGDLVNAVSTIARTFDPNGTNLELSRTLLAVALGEGLEIEDPGQVVQKVFPPGYTDPAMAALQAQQEQQAQGADPTAAAAPAGGGFSMGAPPATAEAPANAPQPSTGSPTAEEVM